MSICINSHNRTTVQGDLSGAPYTISLSTFYVIGGSFIDGDYAVRWSQLYRILFSADRTRDLSGITGKVKCNRFAVGPSIHHGIYAIMSSDTELDIEEPDDFDSMSLPEKHSWFIDILDSHFESTIEWGSRLPPNQTEYLANPMVTDTEYFIPINPPRNTVRRTLSYGNYIADGNTAADPEPGTGKVPPITNGYGGTWFIDGDIRRRWRWSRRLDYRLSSTEESYCDQGTLGGVRPTYNPTWMGVSTFRKIASSVAWIPNELFAWPCSGLYRFYSASGKVDEVQDCTRNYLSVGFLMPLILAEPVSVMGFSSVGVGNLGGYCSDEGYFSDYGRPYADDADGSGVYHPMA